MYKYVTLKSFFLFYLLGASFTTIKRYTKLNELVVLLREHINEHVVLLREHIIDVDINVDFINVDNTH